MLTEKEKALWDSEVKNPTGYVLLKCEDHLFFPGTPGSKPQLGCRECAAADLWQQVATTPPHKRLELLELMEAAIHHMVEAGDQGFVAFENPVIEIDHDAN